MTSKEFIDHMTIEEVQYQLEHARKSLEIMDELQSMTREDIKLFEERINNETK